HHLYPDMPSNRLAQIGDEVEKIAAEFGLPYNTDSFSRQFLEVQRTMLQLTLPNRYLRAPKYNAPDVRSDAVVDTALEDKAPMGWLGSRSGVRGASPKKAGTSQPKLPFSMA